MTIEILPSILAADFANLEAALHEAAKGDCKAVHVDVMDGHFVPNISIGPPVVAALSKVSPLILDVHLMIENPGLYVAEFAKAGANVLTVHVEACPHLHRVIQQIKAAGMKAGVALNPATPLVAIEEVLEDVDLVLIMTVNPGFGGQKFIMSMLPKIRRLCGMLKARGLNDVIVEVDGGANQQSAALLGAAGATWIVAGSAVYKGAASQSIAERIIDLRTLAEEGRRQAQA